MVCKPLHMYHLTNVARLIARNDVYKMNTNYCELWRVVKVLVLWNDN